MCGSVAQQKTFITSVQTVLLEKYHTNMKKKQLNTIKPKASVWTPAIRGQPVANYYSGDANSANTFGHVTLTLQFVAGH